MRSSQPPGPLLFDGRTSHLAALHAADLVGSSSFYVLVAPGVQPLASHPLLPGIIACEYGTNFWREIPCLVARNSLPRRAIIESDTMLILAKLREKLWTAIYQL